MKKFRSHGIGKLLREKRMVQGISQKEISDRIGYSNSQFVSNWERGLADPPMDKMLDLVKILNISKQEILGYILGEKEKEIRRVLKMK